MTTILNTVFCSTAPQTPMTRRILYASNQDPKPSVTYHPTAVGEEFLYRIGVVFGIGSNA